MEDFSADLKARREASGLSLEDVFQRTRINPGFLEALESGRFDILPEAYIRLFLKAYAREVGLDPEDTLARYDARLHAPVPSPSTPPPAEQKRPRPIGPVLGAAALILTAGIGIVVLRDREPSAPLQTARDLAPEIEGAAFPNAGAPAVQPSTREAGSELSTARDPGNPSGEENPRERVVAAYSLTPGFAFADMDSLLTLEGRALESTQVTVSADGEEVFSGSLTAGSARLWRARRRLLIQIERAPGLALSLQAHPLGLLGKPGRRLRVFISRSSIWVEEAEPLPIAPPNPASDF